MANGDHVTHLAKRDSVQTTDATPTTFCAISVPGGIEGIIRLKCWAEGVKTDASKAFAQERQAIGIWNAGAFSLIVEGAIGSGVDFGTSGYAIAIVTSGGFAQIQVTGAVASTVRWQGRFELDFTEQVIT